MPRPHVFLSALASLASLAVASGAQQTGPSSRADWPSYNGSLDGARFSPLTQISTANASQLSRICVFDTGENMAMQSGPVVVNGVLYLTTDTTTYAIDATSCREKWRTPHSYTPLGFLKNNHGVAYMDGRLFRVHGGVHAYALDAASGRVLWDVDFHERTGEGAPMAPIAWNGMVFVGNSGGDNIGVRGHVHALDAQTGREVWRFEVIPDTGKARASWPSGRNSPPPTGGGMWSSFTLDPDQGILYVPAGNPAPDFMPRLRQGANLYANSLSRSMRGPDACADTFRSSTGERTGMTGMSARHRHSFGRGRASRSSRWRGRTGSCTASRRRRCGSRGRCRLPRA